VDVASPQPTLAAALAAVVLAGAALGVALGSGGAGRTVTTVTEGATTVDVTSPAAAVARRASDGVVGILATTQVDAGGTPYDSPQTQEGVVAGSGFVLDRQGHILTSDHVVEGATRLHVTFADGHKVHARVVGRDPVLDLAVLSVRVPRSTLHPLALGSAGSLRVGDPVAAIGDPFDLDRSVSAGIVSAVGREMTAPNGFAIPDAIQTDAAINHGNSGGPLLDARGRVVGVAAQIADSGVDGNVGVGFAVPIDRTARRAIASLERTGRAAHPWLGLALGRIDAILATSSRVQATHGALVTGVVAGGPGAQAGLRGGTTIAAVDGATYCMGGDVITGVGGRRVADPDALETAVEPRAPGDTIALAVVHPDGSRATVKLTLGTKPMTAPEIETATACAPAR
jgi:S1-C subfamily serine protease